MVGEEAVAVSYHYRWVGDIMMWREQITAARRRVRLATRLRNIQERRSRSGSAISSLATRDHSRRPSRRTRSETGGMDSCSAVQTSLCQRCESWLPRLNHCKQPLHGPWSERTQTHA